MFYVMYCFRLFRYFSEMWLRSEHVSRRLRGRLNVSCVSGTKISHHRVQASNLRKLPSIHNNNYRINTSNKCGRLTRWRHRCHLLKEVCVNIYFSFNFNFSHIVASFCIAIENIQFMIFQTTSLSLAYCK